MTLKKKSPTPKSTVKPVVKLAPKKIVRKASSKRPVVNKLNTLTKKNSALVNKSPLSATKKSTKATTGSKKGRVLPVPVAVDDVKLPLNMSKRAVEKSMVLKNLIRHSAIKIAYVAGVCFALVGTSFAGLDLVTSSVSEHQSAQTIDANYNTIDSTSTLTTVPDPAFTLISTIPDIAVEDFRITYSVTNAKQVYAKLISAADIFSINSDTVSADKYRSDVFVHKLPSGYYRLRVYVEPMNDSEQKVFETKMFFVQEPLITAVNTNETSSSSSSEIINATTDATNTDSSGADESDRETLENSEQSQPLSPIFKVESVIPNETSQDFRVTYSVSAASAVSTRLYNIDNATSEPLQTTKLLSDRYRVDVPVNSLPNGVYALRIIAKPEDGSANVVFNTEKFKINKEIVDDLGVIVEDSQVGDIETVEEIPVVPKEAQIIFTIEAPNSELSNIETVHVKMPSEYTFAELYVRPVSSLQARFVSLATKSGGAWQFIVNTKEIPNGKYEFFARTRHNGEIIKSTSITKTILNTVDTVPKTQTVETDTVDIVERQFAPTAEPEVVSSPEVSVDVSEATDELLRSDNLSLNDLFQRYALAVQSGDTILIEIAKRELEAKRKALVNSSLLDTNLRDISSDINEEISSRLAELEKRVVTFEKIRRDKSAGNTAIDTDMDGISDFDEVNIYLTNPDLADSDNDGITDGVEIMRGYDPRDATLEAVMEYESPRDSVGLVREDVLLIEQVLPVTKIEPEEGAPEVIAEIRGKGLPNSFVTLFIFSEPTVVTVRTDADGSFVYTFDKELSDGNHEVYVAVTDNAGEIIAQSNPFSFIKQAQAFTPVDANEAQVVINEVLISETSNYKTVVGLGILAFGLILVMLGLSLRPKDSQSTNVNISDSKKRNPEINEHIDAL